jgi:hypothetical protein
VQACEVVPLQLPSNCPGALPDCAIETASPATVRVPVRDELEALVATLKVIDPVPTCVAGATTERKGELLTAFQEQPAWVVTDTVPDPPPGPNDAGFAALTV